MTMTRANVDEAERIHEQNERLAENLRIAAERILDLETALSQAEGNRRQLEARVAELASESNANETAYSHECARSVSLESEGAELRGRVQELQAQLEATRRAWQGCREEYTEDAKTPHDRAVLEALDAVPIDLLREWADLDRSKSGRLTIIAKEELLRRAARAS